MLLTAICTYCILPSTIIHIMNFYFIYLKHWFIVLNIRILDVIIIKINKEITEWLIHVFYCIYLFQITGDSIRKDDPLVSAIYDHIGEYPRELGAAHFRTQVNMVFPWLQYLGNPSQKFRRMLRSGSIYIWDNFLLPIKVGLQTLWFILVANVLQ